MSATKQGWWDGCGEGGLGKWLQRAAGPRDPPDGSELALHRTKQKLYVAVKELELSYGIGSLEFVKQTEILLSVYFLSITSIAWMLDGKVTQQSISKRFKSQDLCLQASGPQTRSLDF